MSKLWPSHLSETIFAGVLGVLGVLIGGFLLPESMSLHRKEEVNVLIFLFIYGFLLFLTLLKHHAIEEIIKHMPKEAPKEPNKVNQSV